MGDLLKEAIADAKAVRETALANAKAALEEAFTPKLQSMLTKKLKEDEFEDEEVPAEEEEGEEVSDEEGYGEQEELPDEEIPAEEQDEFGDEEVPAEEEGEEGEEKPVDVAVDEEGEEEVPAEEDGEEDEEDLDLEAIIRELEDEEGEELPAEEEDEEAVEEEVDQSSGVGSTDEEGAEIENFDDPAKPVNVTEQDEEEDDESVDEIVDLSELLKGLNEDDEEDEEGGEEVAAENVRLSKSLGEHRKVVKYLRNKLNEVNLLNAKLLFTNKLFRSYNLNNDQKLKIVETFDRAKTSREVKLVYSTLAESFKGRTGNRVSKLNESRSIASKATGSTRAKKVISEGNEMAKRFKKLAGII